MIHELINRKNLPALTSDQWHVVHARLAGESKGKPSFERSIVSEHEDRAAAAIAAKRVLVSLAPMMDGRSPEGRDQVFVRKPDFKSLKTAKHVAKRRK